MMMKNRPLRIFIPHCSDLLTDHLPHGDGLIAHGFIRHLAERGHTLCVAADQVRLRVPLPSNVHLFRCESPRGNLAMSRLSYMWQVRRLFWRLHREAPFDLCHQLNPVFAGISLALLDAGIPRILGTYVARWPEDAAGKSASPLSARLFAGARRLVAGLEQMSADKLLLTTPAAYNRLPEPGALRQKICFLPHGIDAELFSPLPPSCEAGPPTVLFLANVIRRKGIFTLLEAFPKVLERHPECRLYVAGDGSELGASKERAEVLGLGDRILFLGQVDRSTAAQLYRECTLYCLPSAGEPYATSVIEAMSCGKPIVFTDAGGLPHLVGSEGGMGVPVGDPLALAHALNCLLSDPVRRITMGEHNRSRVLETMTWNRVIDRLEEIYRATIAENRRNRRPQAEPVRLNANSAEDCV